MSTAMSNEPLSGLQPSTETGVSVVVCCHNGATRLPAVLGHLAAQQVVGIDWEVIVVDNASTDDTALVPRACWPDEPPAILRVISEPILGLAHARERGLGAARYEVVSFLDDDNWASPNWVQTASQTMEQHLDIGACGGYSQAKTEAILPSWFHQNQRSYAVGSQMGLAGAQADDPPVLWGAGLTIRKRAWLQLVDRGFRPLLSDRQGVSLSSGGDTELCLALRLIGWRLCYEPALQLTHYLPGPRLEWSYLKRLHRAFGESSVAIDPYIMALDAEQHKRKRRLGRIWLWQVHACVQEIVRRRKYWAYSTVGSHEGDNGILELSFHLSRLRKLLRLRDSYDELVHGVVRASWHSVVRNCDGS